MPGEDADAILSRIEAKAAHADIAGALAELAKLPPAVRAPALAWIAKAEARDKAVDASRRLRRRRARRAQGQPIGRPAMIRVILFLALVALIALGVVWIADRPGEVAITWQGYRIETSVMVAAVAVARNRRGIAVLLWSLMPRHPALARPDRDVPRPPPRRARLSRRFRAA